MRENSADNKPALVKHIVADIFHSDFFFRALFFRIFSGKIIDKAMKQER